MSVVPDDAAPATRTIAVDEARAQVTVPLGTPLAEAERALILATLRHCGGVRKRAADLLGISLKTLYNRLVAYGRVERRDLPPREVARDLVVDEIPRFARDDSRR